MVTMSRINDEVSQYKRDLKSVPYLNRKIIQLREKSDYLKYEMTGLSRHSVPLTKAQESSLLPMPTYHGGRRSLTDLIYERDLLEQQIQDCQKRVLACSGIDWLAEEQRAILIDLFILGKSPYDVAADLDLTRSQLHRKVNKMIRSLLNYS